MSRRIAFIVGFLMLFCIPGIIAADISPEDRSDMEEQLSKVFSFVGLENPVVSVQDDKVLVDLELPRTYTEEGTLAYIMINAAEIAPHTNEIIVRISSKVEGSSVEAKALTKDALAYVDGDLTEQEFTDKITVSNVQSALNIIFAVLALIIIVVVVRKIFQFARINKEKEHIHAHHPVHDYIKENPEKKKTAKKKRSNKKNKIMKKR